jgi:hypothetical protein
MPPIFNNKALLFIFTSLTLTGCSNTFVQVGSMLKESIVGLPGDDIPVSEIDSSPYSSIYAKVNDTHQVFVLLALVEAPQTLPATTLTQQNAELKWISSDTGMLVTRNSRLLKTVNLYDGNRVSLSSEQTDPLALGLHLASTPLQWQSTIDWQPGYHLNYQQLSTFTFIADETLLINDKPVLVKKFNELVVISNLNIEYSNQFWVDKTTGLVLQSRQKIAPNLPYIDITLLKPYGFGDAK